IRRRFTHAKDTQDPERAPAAAQAGLECGGVLGVHPAGPLFRQLDGGAAGMNRVISAQRLGKDWRVEAVTPSGERVVILVRGSLRQALGQAARAEPEPE